MSRFLAAYEDLFAKSTDAPVEFGHAGGLAILSTIALRRRWIERGGEQIHPNLFMLLCADSSADRKSTSVKLATNLLKKHKTEKDRVGPDNFTPEGLFTFMSGGPPPPPKKKQNGNDGSSDDDRKQKLEVYLPIGEFGVFLSHADSHSKNLYSEMCNLYDGADIVKSRASSVSHLENPLVTLFGGVAYGMLEKYVKQREWDAGFYPRMLWVTPITRREPFIIVPETPYTEQKLAAQALEDLVLDLSNRAFAMKLAKGAEVNYAEFTKSLVSDEKLEDATVTAQRERLKNVIWKLAILYQIDDDPNADISLQAMERAYKFAQVSWTSFKMVFDKTYGEMHDRFNSKVWNYIAYNTEDIELADGKKDKGVLRRSVNHWQHRRLRDLEAAIATLISRGVIEERTSTVSKKPTKYYVALQEPPK